MLPLIIAGAGAVALLGLAVAVGRKAPMLAETGSIPAVDPDKVVVGRGGKGTSKQSKNVLRWAPKIRTAILNEPRIPENERVDFLIRTLATIHQESGGDPKATSYETEGINNTGVKFKLDKNGNKIPLAQGLGQMIKSTQRMKEVNVKDPYNPDEMIPGMLRFFLWQQSKPNVGKDEAQMARGYYSGHAKIDKGITTDDTLREIQKMKDGPAKTKRLKGYNNVMQYIAYRLRLLDLYGDVR